MLPTTRKGRYLFYRARAGRRLKRAAARWAYARDHEFHPSGRVTSREISLTAFGKQEPREYPKHPALMHPPGQWKHRFRPPPSYGVFGVVPWPPPPFRPPSPTNHPRFAVVRYFFRRLKSIPRLKHIPRQPYMLPIILVPEREFFPFPRYPSGRLNPRWWRERD